MNGDDYVVDIGLKDRANRLVDSREFADVKTPIGFSTKPLDAQVRDISRRRVIDIVVINLENLSSTEISAFKEALQQANPKFRFVFVRD